MEKLLIFRTLLILSVFSISIMSLIPTSLEQQPTVTITTNPNGTHVFKVGVSDNSNLQEYASRDTVHNMLNQQILDLQNSFQNFENGNTFLTYLAIVIGIIATVVGVIVSYILSKRHSKSILDKSVEKMVEIENAKRSVNNKGKLVIHKDESNEQKIVAENKIDFTVDTVLANASDSKLDETKDAKSDANEKKDDRP